ncbi:MAG: alpha/beta hydrolase, partial [Actinomycetota bacterium]|nr:alpha/beta hydrolase [Actinomycetota bacterium]
MTTDSSRVLVEGPWRHEFVPANGSRFHVAVAGPDDRETPLVVLLHGFPQCWWAWRHQIPALGAAGYRVAAMDLRGTGASDKPPLGYDAVTLARDVAGVIRSLGSQRAVVVGHG